MMKKFFLLLVIAMDLWAAEKGDLVLSNGDVLKAARIVAIKSDIVTIVYAGGTRSAHVDEVPLDTLARAHMELEAKRKSEASIQKAAKQAPSSEAELQARQDEINFRLAMAKVREQAQANGAPEVASGVRTPEQELMALKAQFPGKRKDRLTVGIGRRNPMQVTRYDGIEIEVPHGDLWAWYRGMVQTTTMQALPRTLKMIDERIARDLADLGRRGSSSDEAASTQARRTAAWLREDLQRYLGQLRQLAK